MAKRLVGLNGLANSLLTSLLANFKGHVSVAKSNRQNAAHNLNHIHNTAERGAREKGDTPPACG